MNASFSSSERNGVLREKCLEMYSNASPSKKVRHCNNLTPKLMDTLSNLSAN